MGRRYLKVFGKLPGAVGFFVKPQPPQMPPQILNSSLTVGDVHLL